jgi:hypothetical protein
VNISFSTDFLNGSLRHLREIEIFINGLHPEAHSPSYLLGAKNSFSRDKKAGA